MHPSEVPLIRRSALFGGLLVLALSLSAASSALAQTTANPFDAEQRRLAQEVARARGVTGILPLLQFWQGWDEATPAQSSARLDELSRNRRIAPATRAYVDSIRARASLRRGEFDEAHQIWDGLGYITEWNVVGPFDNEGKRGFTREFGPEENRAAPFELGATYAGKEREVRWRVMPDISHIGYTSLSAVFRPARHVCSYATTNVQSERTQDLALWAGAGGAIKVFWNGALVHEDDAYRGAGRDRHAVSVRANAGANRLMVKSCVAEGSWGFYFRVTDVRGGPANVEVSPSSMADVVASSGRPRPAPATALPFFEAAAERGSASALYDLARYLEYTDSEDPAEGRVRQLAARAAEAEPSIAHLEFAIRTAAQRADINRFMQRAIARAPNDPNVMLLDAQVKRAGLFPDSALPVLDRIDALELAGVLGMQARLLRADIFANMDLPMAARRILEEVGQRAAGAPGFARARAEAASAAGDQDAAIALRGEAVALSFTDRASRRVLVADAVRRRDQASARAQLEAIAAIAPYRQRSYRYMASLYEALGDTDKARASYRAALEVAPEDVQTIVAHGEFMLRQQERDGAIHAFSLALELRPQDAATRELLEQVQPQVRTDEAFAANTETLLERRTEGEGYPTTVLQDLTVNTVFENGLGSTFRQLAVQLHNDEGARQFRSYSMQFDPGSQRLDIRLARVHRANGEVLEATQSFEQQLGEPWYRIYYDTRARVLVFSDLEPGDVVELRWRIDDTAHQNVFADYYGDLTFLQGFTPIRNKEYILITPESREFFFNEPNLAGLEHERSVDDGTRTDRYVATDVPAIHSEPSMPGMTQVAPYLHVSTYATWEDVGAWYWGLIQDQLNLDDELRSTVARLTRGMRTDREKVIAIHDWVVANTRYVGLEFGIHGYKPYRVTQIARRGFGDCKDKASLMFAMFREAGVDAHIVLTRTRRNGRIRDLPASLSVFDHAIAYVPSLDLYIDGTAEHNGITELPGMDQGVTVLHVWPEGANLRRTPVLPAERNRRERTLEIQLAANGSAEIRASETVTGAQAPRYRAMYQATGTQEDRLEGSLRNLFPGLQVETYAFENLQTLEAPAEYRYTAEVPQMAQSDGNSLRLGPSVLSDLTRGMAQTATRRHPLDLGEPASYLENRTIRVPPGMRAIAAPTTAAAESPFGRLALHVENSGDTVEIRTEFELRRDQIQPDEYAAFRTWVIEADQLLRQQVVVSQ